VVGSSGDSDTRTATIETRMVIALAFVTSCSA
jgi:hypothetical protein